MDKIAVLISCYNEVLTIQKVVMAFKRFLSEAFLNFGFAIEERIIKIEQIDKI